MAPVSPTEFLSEEGVIRLAQSLAGVSDGGGELKVGIGDDCAVVCLSGRSFCITTDMMVEGVHFSLDYFQPMELGRRIMAANLSDLAAMGARPLWGFLSLGLAAPRRDLVDGVLHGAIALGREYGLTIAGGDTVSAPQMVLNLCLLGDAGTGGALLRKGAKKKDAVCVTGTLGDAQGGLALLQAGRGRDIPQARFLCQRHLCPTPRVALGRSLSQTGKVHAMMDLSDGLASDLARMCRASQVGARVEEELLPISPQAREMAPALGKSAVQWALSGGEDFELLFTCAPGDLEIIRQAVREADPQVPVTPVGVITGVPGVILQQAGGQTRDITWQGFDHFAKGSA